MALPEDERLLLLHNPRCSKSCELRSALDDLGAEYDVRLYLEQPLDREELIDLEARLGRPLADLLRAKEGAYRDAGLHAAAGEAQVLEALLAHPALLERPILVRGSRAIVGRPPEAALALLDRPPADQGDRSGSPPAR